MSVQTWMEQISGAVASGSILANSSVETIVMPNVTVPANYMQNGRALRMTMWGVYGTTSTPTLVFKIRWGGVAGTVLAATGANVMTSAVGGGASMTADWFLGAIIQTRSNGSSATFMTMGNVIYYTSTLGTAGTVTQYGMPAILVSGATGAPGTAAAVSTVDATADTALSVTATWGTSNTANSLQALTYNLESMN